MKKITYTKVRRKAFQIISRFLYYNYSYKPKGLYTSSKQYYNSSKNNKSGYIEVFPNLQSTLSAPADLYRIHSQPKPGLQAQTTYAVVEIPQGRVHTDNACSVAIISADNKLIGDVSFSYAGSEVIPPHKNNIFQQKYFIKPKVYKGVVFSMLSGGSGISNYGHWLIDVLPRLYLLKKSGLYHKVDYFLVPSVKYDYQRDSLKLLGIPAEKLIDGEQHTHIIADTLIASTAPRGNDAIVPAWVVDFLRESFLEKDNSFLSTFSHIYVSRKDSSIRHVVNESELLELLSKYNFTSHQLSSLSFIEKIRLFASSSVIVSPTGAGLTNIIFCKPGTRVLEIFNDSFIVGPFYDLAGKVGLEYNYIIGKTGSKAKNIRQAQEEDIVVDIPKVQNAVEALIERTYIGN